MGGGATASCTVPVGMAGAPSEAWTGIPGPPAESARLDRVGRDDPQGGGGVPAAVGAAPRPGRPGGGRHAFHRRRAGPSPRRAPHPAAAATIADDGQDTRRLLRLRRRTFQPPVFGRGCRGCDRSPLARRRRRQGSPRPAASARARARPSYTDNGCRPSAATRNRPTGLAALARPKPGSGTWKRTHAGSAATTASRLEDRHSHDTGTARGRARRRARALRAASPDLSQRQPVKVPSRSATHPRSNPPSDVSATFTTVPARRHPAAETTAPLHVAHGTPADASLTRVRRGAARRRPSAPPPRRGGAPPRDADR